MPLVVSLAMGTLCTEQKAPSFAVYASLADVGKSTASAPVIQPVLYRSAQPRQLEPSKSLFAPEQPVDLDSFITLSWGSMGPLRAILPVLAI
jgi:hypothetical protein